MNRRIQQSMQLAALFVVVAGGAIQAQTLTADVPVIDAVTGGAQTLSIQTQGPAAYFLLSSESGTSPGLPLGPGLVLPLNPDPVLDYSILNANGPVYQNSNSTTDAAGSATARILLPPVAGLSGLVLHHAFAQYDPLTLAIQGTSNPVSLAIESGVPPYVTVSQSSALVGEIVAIKAQNGL